MSIESELKFECLHPSERLARFGRIALDYCVKSLPGMAALAHLPVYHAEPTRHQVLLKEIAQLESHANDPWQHDHEL